MTSVGIQFGMVMACVTLGANAAAQTTNYGAPPSPVPYSNAVYYPPPTYPLAPPRDVARPVAEPEPYGLRRFSVLAMLGFGTPVGLLGVAGQVKVVDQLALGVGAGFNGQ